MERKVSLEKLLDATSKRLPIVDVRSGEQVSCHNCVGACCKRGMVLSLGAAEADQLRDAGTVISPFTRSPGDPRAGWRRKLYRLDSDCGNLQDDNSCGDYDNRPRACRELPERSPGCIVARDARGLAHEIKNPGDGPLYFQ